MLYTGFQTKASAEGFICEAAIKGRLGHKKPCLQFFLPCWCRGVVKVSCYEFLLGGLCVTVAVG